MEEQMQNNAKIIDLYNKMQKKIIKFSELKCEFLINSFDIYKIHLEGTLYIHNDNLIWKLAILVFGLIFEGTYNFKIVDEETKKYIYILLDFFDEKQKEFANEKANKVIIDIILEKGCKNLGNLHELLSKLNIDEKVIYLYFLLIKFGDEGSDNLIEYLALLLKSKYPDSDFFFEDTAEITFSQLIEKIIICFTNNKIENFSIIKYDKKKEEIIVIKKTNEEIENLLEFNNDIKKDNDNTKTKKKRKKKKKKNYTSGEKKIEQKEEAKEEAKNKTKEENIIEIKDEIKDEIKEEELKNDKRNSISYDNINEVDINKKFEILQNKYMEIKKENETIKKENETIKKENETIKKENETIKKENEAICKEIEVIKQDNEAIKKKYIDIEKKYTEIQNKREKFNKSYKELCIQNKNISNKLNLNVQKCESLNNKLIGVKKETLNLKFILNPFFK